MRTRLWAASGLALLLVVVALVNSRRAQHDRAVAVPEPTVTSAPAPLPLADQNCELWPGRGTTEEAHVTFGTASHPDLVVVSVRCVDVSGDRQDSTVKVLDILDDHRIVATLVRPTQHLHVYEVTANSLGVVVTATEAAPPLPADQSTSTDLGSLFRWYFSTKDGINYVASKPERLALACRATDLAISARTEPSLARIVTSAGSQLSPDAHAPADSRPAAGTPAAGGRLPSVAIVRLRNISARPCVIEGYPEVNGITAAGESVVPNLQLFGPGGGVHSNSAPDIVYLHPGETTSAAVDSADETPAGGTALCNTLTSLHVALPNGGIMGAVRVTLRVCSFEVHPLVAGPTGSSS